MSTVEKMNPLYKTALCTNWANGECKYGKKCNFAHGQAELRRREAPKPTTKENPLYKTALCANFAEGKCKFGDRCNFAHGEAELRRQPRKVEMPKPEPVPEIKKESFVFEEEDFPILADTVEKAPKFAMSFKEALMCDEEDLVVEEDEDVDAWNPSKMNVWADEFVPQSKMNPLAPEFVF